MTVVLSVVFIAALVAIGLMTFVDAFQQNKGINHGGNDATRADWDTVARGTDLQVVNRSGLDDPLLRGAIAGRWVTVEDRMNDIEINVNFRSGTGTFGICEHGQRSSTSGDVLETGDDAFDAALSVTTRSPAEVDEYLSPARRNAVLWLISDDAIDMIDIDEEAINVRFTVSRWKAEELVAAIKLVVDVANIMEAGQKVFMTPPLASDEGNDEGDSDAPSLKVA